LKKTKLFGIRCLAEESKGYGNLSRCLTLARFLRKKGHRSIFIINKNYSAINQIKKSKFQYLIISKRFIYKKELLFFYDIQKKFEFDAIIIDAREFSQKISKDLTKLGTKIILIDDAWCKKVYADLIINVTPIEKYHKYTRINKKSKIFFGLDYYILDPIFLKYKKRISDIRKKKKYTLVISLGGSDPKKLTIKVLKSLMNFLNIDIHVVVGPLFKNYNELTKIVKNQKIKLIHSPTRIWAEFKKADIAISNSGNTLFELAALRIPTICISTSKHQMAYAEEFQKRGFAVNLGLWKYVTQNMINEKTYEIIENESRRKKMCFSAKNMIDGKGVQRSVKIIEDLFKNN